MFPLYERLISEWETTDEDKAKNLGGAWTGLGNLYRDLGNYQTAIEAHLKAQEIFDRLDFNQGKATSLGNLGNAYDSLGQYDRLSPTID